MDTSSLTARALARLIALGETTAEEVARDVLTRAASQNDKTGAYLVVDADGCLAAARAVDRARHERRPLGPLAGVPIALKDNLMTRGLATTCASRILAGYVPPYDGTAVARVREAGLPIVGKTNMDEFAMGSSNENSAVRPVRNPWSLEHVPGGSSGGSAAAVASGAAILGLGSDTGGSVREPASFCGVVGYKPTYGRVSRYGLVAFGSSLDQIGPLARDVLDAALLYNVIAGHDPLDSTSLPDTPAIDVATLRDAPRGLRLGVPRGLVREGLAPEVSRVLNESIAALVDAGMRPADVDLPHVPHCVAVYYIVATAEASSNLARYDGVRYGPRAADPADVQAMYCETRTAGFGPEVKRRIMLGTYALSAGYYDAYYAKAQQVRTLIRQDFEEAFRNVDALILPVAPTPAFRLGEKITDPLEMYLTDAFTIPANLAGLPAISVPAGESEDGLPIGTQILGAPLADGTVFHVAAALERALARGVRTRPLARRAA
jgi:aspartyl-tRNA(Asn)/glutamyl-tRNA(Gln) amidotransferase subunit A